MASVRVVPVLVSAHSVLYCFAALSHLCSCPPFLREVCSLMYHVSCRCLFLSLSGLISRQIIHVSHRFILRLFVFVTCSACDVMCCVAHLASCRFHGGSPVGGLASQSWNSCNVSHGEPLGKTGTCLEDGAGQIHLAKLSENHSF